MMKFKIVYDNEAIPGFGRGWGFACLIEAGGRRILFDTGWDGNLLLSNLRRFGVGVKEVNTVVVSHAHWDHLGGLPCLRGLQLYVPRSFSRPLKEELASRFELHEVRGPQEICEGVWTTGELGGGIKEQSLVLKTGRGLVVVVGCSHPGVRNILSAASGLGKVFGVIGGMHGFRDYGALRGLKLVAPAHCTVHKERIAELFPDAYFEVRAGKEIGPI